MQQLIYVILAGLLLSTPAAAQQMATPSQIALQVNGAVAVLAQRAEYAEAQVATLQKQLADLKIKCGDTCKDNK